MPRAPLVASLLASAFIAAAFPATAQTLTYTLTIYVDEGGHSYGHVFVELSDGKNNLYRGFYPEQAREDTFSKAVAPFALGGGEVRDDRNHHWDVKRTYHITKDGFRDGLQMVEKTGKRTWCPTNHCGDFALGVAKAAGVPLNLPMTLEGKDLPGAFAAYLLQHGGVTRAQEAVRCKDDVTRRAEAGAAAIGRCGGCTADQKREHLAELSRLREKQLATCDLIGLSLEEQRRVSASQAGH